MFDTHVIMFDIILTVQNNEVKYWLAGPDRLSTMSIKLEMRIVSQWRREGDFKSILRPLLSRSSPTGGTRLFPLSIKNLRVGLCNGVYGEAQLFSTIFLPSAICHPSLPLPDITQAAPLLLKLGADIRHGIGPRSTT